MKLSLITSTLAISVTSTLALAAAVKHETALQHANHLFNAVHNAMRQWGSSVDHNGMTAFIAAVPAHTEFYHGTRTPDQISGTEWLAFEPEHALLFAGQLRGSSPGGHRKQPSKGPADGPRPPRAGLKSDPQDGVFSRHTPGAQTPLRGEQSPFINEWEHGYLHTYRTKHALRLLYVDGQGGAKSAKGTLDLQDIVILRNALETTDPIDHDHRGPLQEWERATLLCRRAKHEWQDQIDGILRMEGGFEVILCDFEKHLDVVHIKQATAVPKHELAARHEGKSAPQMLSYYRAVAARYDGIGAGRVELDFDNAVSLFAYPGAVYFDEAGFPRAVNDSAALHDVRAAVDAVVCRPASAKSYDWQAVASMVVDRYADRIAYLTSGELASVSMLHSELDFALWPFIDHADRNAVNEIARCTEQFLPSDADLQGKEGLNEMVIRNVTATICTYLHNARNFDSVSSIQATLSELKQWLRWPAWKRCRGCELGEVCFVPMWPAGSPEDFERPRCRSNVVWDPSEKNYWSDRDDDQATDAFMRRFGPYI